MAKPTAKEAEVTCKERCLLRRVEVAEYFLLVIPFWTSDFKTDLAEVNLPEAKFVGLESLGCCDRG
jgi:hypothetical protein